MRRFLLAPAAVAVLAWPAVVAAPSHAGNAWRAEASFNAMEQYFFDRASGDYRERRGGPAGSHAWPFSQALAAHIALAAVPSLKSKPSVRARLATLERRFRKGSTYSAWPNGDVYLDDNEWLAEDFLDWNTVSRDGISARRTAAIFAAVVDAWDDVSKHPCSGGVFWATGSENDDRNTVSTANGAVIGLRLYEVTRNTAYLTWAKTMLGWLDRCMLAPNGLYWDHIDLSGRVNTAQWSYNQGSVIAADVLLYRTTGDSSVLVRAEQLADASIAYFDARWKHGEPPEFAALFFRGLLSLADTDGRADYVAAAEQYADTSWTTKRDPRTGLFRYSGKPNLLQQAGLVQLYAALAARGVTVAH